MLVLWLSPRSFRPITKPFRRYGVCDGAWCLMLQTVAASMKRVRAICHHNVRCRLSLKKKDALRHMPSQLHNQSPVTDQYIA